MITEFETTTGITPSEIILALAGLMLISEHQLPVSMIFVGGLMVIAFYVFLTRRLFRLLPVEIDE